MTSLLFVIRAFIKKSECRTMVPGLKFDQSPVHVQTHPAAAAAAACFFSSVSDLLVFM